MSFTQDSRLAERIRICAYLVRSIDDTSEQFGHGNSTGIEMQTQALVHQGLLDIVRLIQRGDHVGCTAGGSTPEEIERKAVAQWLLNLAHTMHHNANLVQPMQKGIARKRRRRGAGIRGRDHGAATSHPPRIAHARNPIRQVAERLSKSVAFLVIPFLALVAATCAAALGAWCLARGIAGFAADYLAQRDAARAALTVGPVATCALPPGFEAEKAAAFADREKALREKHEAWLIAQVVEFTDAKELRCEQRGREWFAWVNAPTFETAKPYLRAGMQRTRLGAFRRLLNASRQRGSIWTELAVQRSEPSAELPSLAIVRDDSAAA